MTANVELKKERGKRVRVVRSMSGLSIAEFAREIGVTDRAIIGWEGGKIGGLTEKGAEKIATVIKSFGVICSSVWLMHGMGTQPILTNEIYNKPIFSEINSTKNNKEIITPNSAVKNEIACFHKNNLSAVTLQIIDDSMEPFLHLNDIAGGKRLFANKIQKALHKNCILETEENQILCRYLTEGSMPNTFNLNCLNPKTSAQPITLNNVKLISAAPVIWTRILFED